MLFDILLELVKLVIWGSKRSKVCLYTFLNFQLVSEQVHLLWFKYLSVILDPLCLFVMDCALYASFHDLVGNGCNMPRVCENASMSVNSRKCDDMLFESMGVADKLLKKNAKKFQKNLSKLFCEKDDLIAKLNESNKLVEKY